MHQLCTALFIRAYKINKVYPDLENCRPNQKDNGMPIVKSGEIFILGASSCEEDAATQVMKVHKYL